jgi:hypothetical protein
MVRVPETCGKLFHYRKSGRYGLSYGGRSTSCSHPLSRSANMARRNPSVFFAIVPHGPGIDSADEIGIASPS